MEEGKIELLLLLFGAGGWFGGEGEIEREFLFMNQMKPFSFSFSSCFVSLCSCFAVEALDHSINARKNGTAATGTFCEREDDLVSMVI